ncbi:MAG TPA: pyridoxamine 5'-phosphate oxidase family protein [Chthoniobacteraceae bacterium]|jgi:general stress protein 26|nr:pyridoxamine 5'-phosphate oxidase family protein [Chthoniobacteraceae bacterium]
MDSINRNQPEQNRADLSGAEAAHKVKDLAERAESCFFCTEVVTPGSSRARPMAVQQVDEQGNLWFLSASDSHKNEEVERDPVVHLYFQANAHSGFLSLTGTVHTSRDRAKIEELWKPIMKTWFTEGIDDPRITVLRVSPTDGYYWDTKHGRAVAGLKMLVGAAIGKTLDDSIEGTLSFPRTPGW